MPRITRIQAPIPELKGRKRVAAYARVSADSENLLHSLSAQISHYSRLIQNNPEWEYAGVFVDEAKTGTSMDRRDEFNRLMAECDAGNIDIILVKSISRFARNTVDTLVAVRHLKEAGVEVRFERENISSLDSDGELMLTILASYAQEESESISRNQKWAIRKRFEKGIPNTSLRCFGYDWDSDSKALVINESEAVWVRYIYNRILEGESIRGVTADLKDRGVTALRGETIGRTTVRRILTSRLYTGDVILQQYYSPIVKKPRRNLGEAPQYEIADDHGPIISREDFDRVQEILAGHRVQNMRYRFSGIVRCGKCGYACSHVQTGNGKKLYERIECNRRKSGKCDLLPIQVDELERITDSIGGKPEKIILYDERIEFMFSSSRMQTVKRNVPAVGRYRNFFSHRIFCGECGGPMRKMRKAWICRARVSDRNACAGRRIPEDELVKAAEWVTGETDGYENAFYSKVGKTVVFNDRVVFHMKGGGDRIWVRQ